MASKALYFSVVVLVLSLFSSWGQDLRSDLRKIQEVRSQDKWRKMQVKYTSFETHSSSEAEDTEEATIMEKGIHSYYLDNRMSTSLFIKGKSLVIDKEDQVIYLMQQKIVMDLLANVQPDSLLKLCSAINYLGKSENLHTYELLFSSSMMEFEKVIMVLDMGKLYVKEAVLYYSKSMPKLLEDKEVKWMKPRLKITYHLLPLTDRDKEKISFDHYLLLKDGKWEARSPYHNYKIIDQTAKP